MPRLEAEVHPGPRRSRQDEERQTRLGVLQSQDDHPGLPGHSAPNLQSQDAWDAWDAVLPDERRGTAPERLDFGSRPDRSADEV